MPIGTRDVATRRPDCTGESGRSVVLAGCCDRRARRAHARLPQPAQAGVVAGACRRHAARRLDADGARRDAGVGLDERLTAAVRARFADADAWRQVGDVEPIVVGRTGVAWDDRQVRAAAGEPVKREGDGRSPAGVFALDTAFGFDSRADRLVGASALRAAAHDDGVRRRRAIGALQHDRGPRQRASAWTGRAPRRCGRSISTRTACTWRTTRRRRRRAARASSCTSGRGRESVTAGCTAMDVDALKELIALDRSAAAADARAASAERAGAAAEGVAAPLTRAIGDAQLARSSPSGTKSDADRACDGERRAGRRERSLLRIDRERVDVVRRADSRRAASGQSDRSAKLRGALPPVGVWPSAVSRPSRASTEKTAMLSWPRLDAVDEASGRMHDDLGGRCSRRWCRRAASRSDCRCTSVPAVGFQANTPMCVRQLVDDVDVARARMDGEMARTRARLDVRPNAGVRGVIEPVRVDRAGTGRRVGAEVAREQQMIVGGEVGGMRVRRLLSLRVRAVADVLVRRGGAE